MQQTAPFPILGRMNDSSNGTALITGAGQRIGRAIAQALGAAGWPVAIHFHRSEAAANATREDVRAAGGSAEVFTADLRDEAETEGLIQAAADSLGPVTCLVNNASIFEHDGAETVTRESWDAHMETNLRAPFILMQAMAAARPEGTTANVINILDERVWNLTPHFVSYTLSKAGLWTLTQTMALALAPHIRVNAVGPGPTLPSPRQSKAQFARQEGLMPLGRGTTPDQIADAVRFILAAPAMTGQMIALDGGQHLGWEQSRPDDPPPDE